MLACWCAWCILFVKLMLWSWCDIDPACLSRHLVFPYDCDTASGPVGSTQPHWVVHPCINLRNIIFSFSCGLWCFVRWCFLKYRNPWGFLSLITNYLDLSLLNSVVYLMEMHSHCLKSIRFYCIVYYPFFPCIVGDSKCWNLWVHKTQVLLDNDVMV